MRIEDHNGPVLIDFNAGEREFRMQDSFQAALSKECRHEVDIVIVRDDYFTVSCHPDDVGVVMMVNRAWCSGVMAVSRLVLDSA